MGILVNIDNGGTFTDVCISDGARLVHAKSPTTAHDLTQCFIDVLTRGSRELYGEEDLGRLIRDIDCLRYSTTAGTNAVVEHKGTPVAVLVEAGEEQTLYGGQAILSDNSLWQAMVPHAPCGITVSKNGTVDGAELTKIVNHMLSNGALRMIVALRSKEAEQSVKDELLERYPRHLLGAIPFLISTELVDDSDDARRTVTAVVNSYLHPGMEHFLYGAETICKDNHLHRPLLIYRNDGDSARVAKTTAIKTWGSGPRGGLEGTIAYARLYKESSVLAMDIGGTTTDLSLVVDENAQMMPYGEVGGLKTSLSMPNQQSFGLGGSSIIEVVNGNIEIGPESVGASPGPACFARGGTNATLTDALLVCGVIDADNYLGGALKLDKARAEQALLNTIGEPLGVDALGAAIKTIEAFEKASGANLSQAVRSGGSDPATTCLVAFGGGGPMIVTGIAEAAGIKRIIIPRLASVFSAFGIGFSHLAHEYQAPLVSGDADAIAAELRVRAQRDMYGEGVAPEECRYEPSLWGVEDDKVVVAPISDAAGFMARVDGPRVNFKAVYELPTSVLTSDDGRRGEATPSSGSTSLVMSAEGPSDIATYDDRELTAGRTITGPGLIRGAYLTCLIREGWSLRVSTNLDLVIEAN
ncbi:MAG: N-methylhydantoinase A [Gammaproteobacteria bacterium]|jgi:N-methylhydantoinase A